MEMFAAMTMAMFVTMAMFAAMANLLSMHASSRVDRASVRHMYSIVRLTAHACMFT